LSTEKVLAFKHGFSDISGNFMYFCLSTGKRWARLGATFLRSGCDRRVNNSKVLMKLSTFLPFKRKQIVIHYLYHVHALAIKILPGKSSCISCSEKARADFRENGQSMSDRFNVNEEGMSVPIG
jgi:hypothetical protein